MKEGMWFQPGLQPYSCPPPTPHLPYSPNPRVADWSEPARHSLQRPLHPLHVVNGRIVESGQVCPGQVIAVVGGAVSWRRRRRRRRVVGRQSGSPALLLSLPRSDWFLLCCLVVQQDNRAGTPLHTDLWRSHRRWRSGSEQRNTAVHWTRTWRITGDDDDDDDVDVVLSALVFYAARSPAPHPFAPPHVLVTVSGIFQIRSMLQ